jgi:GT2 family glycosyltransferase
MTDPKASETPDGLRIAAGVLHHRYWPQVQKTVNDLLSQTRPPDEVLLLDHASGDGSAERLREAYPQFEVVETPDNRGPAGGMNRLIAALLAKDVDAVFPLPDDIELAPDTLELLGARLVESSSLGAVAPLVAHQGARELVFCAGGYVDPRTWDLEFREFPTGVSEWAEKPPQEADFLGTGAILMRTSAARGLDPMPEHFYHGFDDVDYTLRLRARGWRLECVPAAVVWQDLGDRSQDELLPPANPYLLVRNQLGVIARNGPRRKVAREMLRVVKWLMLDAIRPRSGSRDDLKGRLMGLVDFCRGHWGAPPAGL